MLWLLCMCASIMNIMHGIQKLLVLQHASPFLTRVHAEAENSSSPKPFQGRVKLHKGRGDCWAVKPDIMWGCHGDQALHSGQRHCASFCWPHQTPAYPVVVIIFIHSEHAVRALHGHGHTVWRKRNNSDSRQQQAEALDMSYCHRIYLSQCPASLMHITMNTETENRTSGFLLYDGSANFLCSTQAVWFIFQAGTSLDSVQRWSFSFKRFHLPMFQECASEY